MMKAIDRLLKYIDYKGIKIAPFERQINLSNGYIGKQNKRKADLGESVLNKILDNCPDVNPIWLLTGQGEMLRATEKEVYSNVKEAGHVTGDIALNPIDDSLGIKDPEEMNNLAFQKKMHLFYAKSLNEALSVNNELRLQLREGSNEIERLHVVIKSLKTKLKKYEKGESVG